MSLGKVQRFKEARGILFAMARRPFFNPLFYFTYLHTVFSGSSILSFTFARRLNKVHSTVLTSNPEEFLRYDFDFIVVGK